MKSPAISPYATEYVNGMQTMVIKAGSASPMYAQFTSITYRIMRHPTKTRVHPVAHGGIDAKIGAKNMLIRKQTPVVMAVNPVLPPSVMPAPDSMNAVTGEQPKSDETDIVSASAQYAIVDRGKSPVSGSTTPENLAME